MKKLFLNFLLITFLFQIPIEGMKSFSRDSVLKNISLFFKKFSLSRSNIFRGFVSLVLAIGLLKLSEKALEKLLLQDLVVNVAKKLIQTI